MGFTETAIKITLANTSGKEISIQDLRLMFLSRARDQAELVTDDATALQEQLEAVTGEHTSGLEGTGVMC